MIKKPNISKLKRAKKMKRLVHENVVTPVMEKAVEKANDLNPLVAPKQDEPLSLNDVPKITDQNITEHREEVLKGARKYIYPLAHSKHRIVVITLSITGAVIVAFFAYCMLAMYRYYQYNTFLYKVSQVIPFPVGKAGDDYVSYENYLFEVRHFTHYYQAQRPQNDSANATQIKQFKKQALDDTINNAYVKKLAKQNNISVSDKEVDDRISTVKAQNRLGSSNKVFADVLRDYWGWSITDFKRSLKEQMLSEKVRGKLDTAANTKANAIIAQLKSGADFAAIAKDQSDDSATKAAGGDYGSPISKDNPNVSPQVISELFKLKAGQYSTTPVIAGSTLEILKVNSNDGSSVTAQHISINLQALSTYIDKLKAKEPAKTYVKF